MRRAAREHPVKATMEAPEAHHLPAAVVVVLLPLALMGAARRAARAALARLPQLRALVSRGAVAVVVMALVGPALVARAVAAPVGQPVPRAL